MKCRKYENLLLAGKQYTLMRISALHKQIVNNLE